MTDSHVHLHHVGCLVPAIEDALESYAALGFRVSGRAAVSVGSQKVDICFLDSGDGTLIELVEPAEDNRFLRRLLDKGVNFYHLGFLCGDLSSTLGAMTSQGGRILTRFCSEAFEGRECVFVLTPLGQMIELIASASGLDSHAV
jgi:catechol 2,3-dioxygenase-like lactoylglutathione lyase family enzyme